MINVSSILRQLVSLEHTTPIIRDRKSFSRLKASAIMVYG